MPDPLQEKEREEQKQQEKEDKDEKTKGKDEGRGLLAGPTNGKGKIVVLYSTGGKHQALRPNPASTLFYPAQHLVSTWRQR